MPQRRRIDSVTPSLGALSAFSLERASQLFATRTSKSWAPKVPTVRMLALRVLARSS